ncbi:tetratricopeptide repeat protein [Nocardioides aquiterrae]|uniref:Tetratricopeptide repeat protein n=1 Tax=Nocardioides aquiterrae TaxID=203799 RepID=A0ABN1UKY4_9ACTN
MSQQPFSRPGAVDLSGFAGATPAGAPEGTPAGSSYAVVVTEQNFQSTVEASTTAPVFLVFYSPTRMPESADLARDLEILSGEFEGRFLVGLVDIDQVPQIAQAMQIPSIPLVVAVLDGRPAPLFQDVLPLDQLRAQLTQVMQQLTANGVAGRHQPRHVAAEGEDGEPAVDPRYAAAQDALGEGDIDRAVAEYQKLVDANPADAEAAAGLAMAKVLQRTAGVDLGAAREAAAANPDDVDAQTMVADLDMLGGHVEDAFNRLVELVRRTSGDDRDRAREHLLGLFAAVGNDDPRVLRGRQNLASALF